MSHKSDLVVIVALRREQAVYLDVLRDWSALDLVADFVMVDGEGSEDIKGAPCMAVSGGRVRSARLRDELARRSITTSAHVVCLSHMAASYSTVGPERGLRTLREVRDALPMADVTWVHVSGVTVNSDPAPVGPSDLAWTGAHNVVLAPENAQSPLAGVSPIVGGRANPVTHTHLAAGLCSAVGLWKADRRTAFFGEPDVAGEQITALRTYSRHLDANSVQSGLVQQLMDLSERYPVPVADGLPAQTLEDEPGGATTMADRLLEKHRDVLARRRDPQRTTEAQPISFLKAVGLMLRFLGKAIVGAPKALMHSLVHAASRGLAAATQTVAFGPDSAYVVTVRGIRGIKPDGSVADVDEMDGELGGLLGQLAGERGSVPPEHHDLSGLWTDFTHAGLTLLDGAKRSDGLDPISRGSGIGIVTDPRIVAPNPDDRFEVASDLCGHAGTERVSPYDLDVARRTSEMLGAHAAKDPQLATQIAQERARLRDWFAGREATYTGRVGQRLYDEMSRTRREVVEYADELVAAEDQPDVPGDIAASQTALAKVLFAITGVGVLVVVALLGMGVQDALTWTQVIPAIGIALLMWLGVATVVFTRKQQRLFQLLHRRQQAAERLTQVKEHLAEALVDLRRLQRTYRQYLDWSRALGTFVQSPWGVHTPAEDREAPLGAGYPHNHRFGTALPDGDAIERVLARLRPQLFPVGWTSRAWDAFVGDLPSIGADSHFLEEDPGIIYSDRSVSTRSILTQWSEAVSTRAWTGGQGQIVNDLHAALEKDGDHHRDQLLSRVRTLDIDGDPSIETYTEFMAGVEGRQPVGSFSRQIFAAVPEGEPWKVGDTLTPSGGDGLGNSLFLTQLTVGFTPRDLAFVGQPPEMTSVTEQIRLDPGQAPQV